MEKFSRRLSRSIDLKLQILGSFADRKGQFEGLTWSQIQKRSHLSEGALSKYVKTLFGEGYLRGEILRRDNRLVAVYSLAHPELGTSYEVTQKDQGGETIRFGLSKDLGDRRILVQRGMYRRMRKEGKGEQKKVFRKTGELMLTPVKDRKLELT